MKQHMLLAYISEELGADSIFYTATACEAIRKQLANTPDEMRESFFHLHCFKAPFAKLAHYINKHDADVITINEITSDTFFDDVLSNGDFIQVLRAHYINALPKNKRTINAVVTNLGDSVSENLHSLTMHIAALGCAQKCQIIIRSEDENYHVIASNDGLSVLPPACINLIKQAEAVQGNIFGTASEDFVNALAYPLYANNKVSGYLLIHTRSVFNNINDSLLDEISSLIPLLKMNVASWAIESDATLDKLTGGLNRNFLDAALDAQIEKAQGEFSIIMTDLDKFKHINDAFGHQTGDMVIREAGKLIRSHIRKDTPFGRFGGEEFVIILDNTSAQDALRIAEELRKTIENARILGSKRAVTISMGIATFGVHANNKKELIEKADKALYYCKQNGRNQSAIYNTSFETKHDDPIHASYGANSVVTGNALTDAMRIRLMLDVLALNKSFITTEERVKAAKERLKEMTDDSQVFTSRLLAVAGMDSGMH